MLTIVTNSKKVAAVTFVLCLFKWQRINFIFIAFSGVFKTLRIKKVKTSQYLHGRGMLLFFISTQENMGGA